MAELPSDIEPQNPESICDLLIEPVHRELAPYCYDTINTTVRNRKPSRRGSHQFKPSRRGSHQFKPSRRGTQNQKSNRKPSRRGKVISSSPQDEAHRIKSQIGSPQDEAKSSVRPDEALQYVLSQNSIRFFFMMELHEFSEFWELFWWNSYFFLLRVLRTK